MSELDDARAASRSSLDEDNVAVESRAPPNMLWIAGGTFAMGSDAHYPEERPAHRVKVDGFWLDRTPVTNREFRRFVEATGYVTLAEVAPDPKDYPGARVELTVENAIQHSSCSTVEIAVPS